MDTVLSGSDQIGNSALNEYLRIEGNDPEKKRDPTSARDKETMLRNTSIFLLILETSHTKGVVTYSCPVLWLEEESLI